MSYLGVVLAWHPRACQRTIVMHNDGCAWLRIQQELFAHFCWHAGTTWLGHLWGWHHGRHWGEPRVHQWLARDGSWWHEFLDSCSRQPFMYALESCFRVHETYVLLHQDVLTCLGKLSAFICLMLVGLHSQEPSLLINVSLHSSIFVCEVAQSRAQPPPFLNVGWTSEVCLGCLSAGGQALPPEHQAIAKQARKNHVGKRWPSQHCIPIALHSYTLVSANVWALPLEPNIYIIFMIIMWEPRLLVLSSSVRAKEARHLFFFSFSLHNPFFWIRFCGLLWFSVLGSAGRQHKLVLMQCRGLLSNASPLFNLP